MSAPDFSVPLFGCLGDIPLCLYTYFCPTCSAAQNWADIKGEKCQLDHFCFMPIPYWTRQEIRKRKHMKANGCGDTCVLCCCTPCEIVQEGREIKTCPPAPASEYYFGQGPQQNLIQDQKYDAQPQQGYAPPPPQGYAPPPPQGYAPPPPGYAPPQPGYPQ